MIRELDIALFRLINGQWAHTWLDGLASALQHPWWLWPPVAVLAAWLLIKGGRKGRVFVLTLAAAVIATDVFCAQILKPLIARPRPCVELEGVRALLGVKKSWSMPSNHAANTAAAAFVIGAFYRRWIVPAIAVVLVVGFTRIYLGVHYPLDILLGWAMGAVIAALALTVQERLIERQPHEEKDKNPKSSKRIDVSKTA